MEAQCAWSVDDHRALKLQDDLRCRAAALKFFTRAQLGDFAIQGQPSQHPIHLRGVYSPSKSCTGHCQALEKSGSELCLDGLGSHVSPVAMLCGIVGHYIYELWSGSILRSTSVAQTTQPVWSNLRLRDARRAVHVYSMVSLTVTNVNKCHSHSRKYANSGRLFQDSASGPQGGAKSL